MTNMRELANRAVELAWELAELGEPALREAGLLPSVHTVRDLPESSPAFDRVQELLREKEENARLRGVLRLGVDCRTGARNNLPV